MKENKAAEEDGTQAEFLKNERKVLKKIFNYPQRFET